MNDLKEQLRKVLKQLEDEITTRETAASALRVLVGAKPEMRKSGLSGMPLWQVDVMAQLQTPFSVEKFQQVSGLGADESCFVLGQMMAARVARRIGSSWTFELINEWSRDGKS
jgi:hypothetical protein